MEIDFNALFGVEEGENDQETAEPGNETQTDEEGANDQEIAEPGKTEDKTESPGEETSDEQTPQERAKYAAARRKAEAERDAAIAQARAEAQADVQRQLDEAFKKSGIINPYTGRPISSKAEFDEYQKRYQNEQRQSIINKAGLSEEEFTAFVGSLPEVSEAKAAKEAAEREIAAAQEEKARVKIEQQIKEIAKMNPDIKAISDLSKMETYNELYEYVKKGNSLVDAYKLANWDALTQENSARARQAALNSVNGKSHLSPAAERGTGREPVPASVMSEYRAFMPEATDAEIEKHYNNYLKSKMK